MLLLKYYLPTGKSKEITDKDVSMYLIEKRIPELSDFIYQRHYRRYIRPFEYKAVEKIKPEKTNKKVDKYSLLYKNGFSIMANCCLLIETIEAFQRGWDNTRDKSELAFLKFFTRDKNFIEFSSDDIPTQFFKNIRCGILHQGETTGGWAITRKGELLLNKSNKVIDATLFLKQLKQSLIDYKKSMEESDWNNQIWKNASIKLKSILRNIKM